MEEKLSLIVVQEFVTVTLLSFAENGAPHLVRYCSLQYPLLRHQEPRFPVGRASGDGSPAGATSLINNYTIPYCLLFCL